MTDSEIKRFKDRGDYTADEHLRAQRGERVESDEYRAAVQRALSEAGLWDPEDTPPENPNESTAEQHLTRLQRGDR